MHAVHFHSDFRSKRFRHEHLVTGRVSRPVLDYGNPNREPPCDFSRCCCRRRLYRRPYRPNQQARLIPFRNLYLGHIFYLQFVLLLDVFFAVDTELMVHRSRPLVQPGESGHLVRPLRSSSLSFPY